MRDPPSVSGSHTHSGDGLRLPMGTNFPSLTAMIVTSLSGARLPVGEVGVASDARERRDREMASFDRLRRQVGGLVSWRRPSG